MSDDLYDPFTPKFSAEMFGFFNGLFWVGGGGGGRLEIKRFRCFNKRSFICVLGVGMRGEERGSVQLDSLEKSVSTIAEKRVYVIPTFLTT